ncbi:MAG: hypothetical protein CMQ41_10965 [Gammaproteobacteria bacterium]|nr:hypothetical protein [Gammaproteobacteria bacterium]
MGRNIPTPFILNLDKMGQKEEISIEIILRLIPGKRLVGISSWRNQKVILKLFFKPGHSQRNMLSDIRGITLLQKRHIPTPEILLQASTTDKKGAALLIEYLEQGISLKSLVEKADEEEQVTSHIKVATTLIAKCHQQGLWQNDIHLDNFMMVEETAYILDGGDIREVSTDVHAEASLQNLALFLAQFTVGKDRYIPTIISIYQSVRENFPEIELEDFILRVKRQRNGRLGHLEKKLFRSTTVNRAIRNQEKFVVYNRQIHSNEVEKFIENPGIKIDWDEIIKNGNASTVYRIALGGDRYVLKRYNLKSFWHGFKYLFRRSRAHHSWRNAWVLNMLGIDTPHPYLMYEERMVWFLRKRAYFLCEDLNEKNLLDKLEVDFKELPIEKIVRAFRALFEIMIEYKISHGDMKASNFVFHDDRLYVLDLDSMKRHKNRDKFTKAMKKDLDRFLRNWEGGCLESRFKQLVADINLIERI